PGGSAASPTRGAYLNHVGLLHFPGHFSPPPQAISRTKSLVVWCRRLRLFRGWHCHKPFEPLRYLSDGLHRAQFPFCQPLSFPRQPYTKTDNLVIEEWAFESITTLIKKIDRCSKGSTLGSVHERVTLDQRME